MGYFYWGCLGLGLGLFMKIKKNSSLKAVRSLFNARFCFIIYRPAVQLDSLVMALQTTTTSHSFKLQTFLFLDTLEKKLLNFAINLWKCSWPYETKFCYGIALPLNILNPGLICPSGRATTTLFVPSCGWFIIHLCMHPICCQVSKVDEGVR